MSRHTSFHFLTRDNAFVARYTTNSLLPALDPAQPALFLPLLFLPLLLLLRLLSLQAYCPPMTASKGWTVRYFVVGVLHLCLFLFPIPSVQGAVKLVECVQGLSTREVAVSMRDISAAQAAYLLRLLTRCRSSPLARDGHLDMHWRDVVQAHSCKLEFHEIGARRGRRGSRPAQLYKGE